MTFIEIWEKVLKPKSKKIRIWLLYTVLASLCPFIFALLGLISDSKPPTLVAVLGHGDLYPVATVLTAAGLGEASGRKSKVFAGLLDAAAFGAWFDGGAAAFLYAHVVGTIGVSGSFHPFINTYLSISMFVLAVAATIVCVVLPEEAEKNAP